MKPEPPPAVDRPADPPTANSLPGLIATLALATAATFWIHWRCPTPLSLGIAALTAWVCLAATIQFFHSFYQTRAGRPNGTSRFATHGQWFCLATALAAFAWAVAPVPGNLGGLAQSGEATLRSCALIYLAVGGVLFVHCQFLESLQQRLQTATLAPMLRLVWLLSPACGIAAGLIVTALATGRDYAPFPGWVALGIASALAVEPWTRQIVRPFVPKGLHQPPLPAGESLWLKTLCSRDAASGGWLKELERVVGQGFRQLWVFHFLRAAMAPVCLAALLLAWSATGLHSVPIGSRGVLVTMGRWQAAPLEPGLHATWPWPFQQILSVETRRVREIGLGFEKESNAPVLWTKPHVEGERNLLVDHGETLLTINVPVLYRIANPVEYLAASPDPEGALKALAERQLVRVAAARESFHLMTDDREAIAANLRQSLQAEADRRRFGVEIVFVGLKDIHPPMNVAPAYQAVVSAQESKEAAIDQARAYEAKTIPITHSEALALTVAAEAERSRRIAQAMGETRRFAAVAEEEAHAPALVRARLEYDAYDEVLPKATKTIVGVSPTAPPAEYDLDFRPAATLPGDVPKKPKFP